MKRALSLIEAKGPSDYRDELLRYIERRYSENDADETRTLLRQLAGQRGGASEFKRQLSVKYLDEKIDDLIGKMIGAGIAVKNAQRDASTSKPEKKEKSGKEIRVKSDRQFIDPETAAEKDAAIAAIRAQRDSIGKGFSGGPAKKEFDPKKDRWHDVGTAGAGLPQKPQKLGFANPKSGETQEVDVDDVKPHDPKDRAKPSKSGIVDAQKQVDRLTKQKGVIAGDALARRLGVPSTADRTTVDEMGNENVAIWSPDRVTKFLDVDNRQDKTFVMDAQRYVDQMTKDKGAEFGDAIAAKLGVPTTADRTTNGKVEVLTPDEVEARVGLDSASEKFRVDFFKKHDQTLFTRDKLVAQGHIKKMGFSVGGEKPPSFPGTFHGQRSRFAGGSGETAIMRPDQATGRFIRGKVETSPEEKGFFLPSEIR